MTEFPKTYQDGYMDGMKHLEQQVGPELERMTEQLQGLVTLLHKAVFVQPVSNKPKPMVNLWLIFEDGRIATGFYINQVFIADSGAEVSPKFWCLIPPVLTDKPNDTIAVDPSRSSNP